MRNYSSHVAVIILLNIHLNLCVWYFKSVTCINLFNTQLALWVGGYGRIVTFLSLLHLINHIILKTTLQSSIINPVLQVKKLSLKVIVMLKFKHTLKPIHMVPFSAIPPTH